MFAFKLLKTSYTFGGKNPQSGLNCSGLISFLSREAVGRAAHWAIHLSRLLYLSEYIINSRLFFLGLINGSRNWMLKSR